MSVVSLKAPGCRAGIALPRLAPLGTLTLLTLAAGAFSLGGGPVDIAPGRVLAILAEAVGLETGTDIPPAQRLVLLAIRLPRVLLGLLVGATLGLCGATVQGLFRNPLADPALIGIASGAALGAALVIVAGVSLPLLPNHAVPLAAFAGALVASWLVYRLASVQGRIDTAALLLAGIAVNALAGAVTGLFTYLADDEQLRTLTFWTLGSLGGADWRQVLTGLPLLALTLTLVPLQARALNALLLGEAEAGHLGFAVSRIKRRLTVLVALGVGTAVALSGIIGFVGLVVPHLLRLSLGPDHRTLLPGSALLGAALLVLADRAARTLAAPAEVPIGILTALFGGPFFLWLLRRHLNRA